MGIDEEPVRIKNPQDSMAFMSIKTFDKIEKVEDLSDIVSLLAMDIFKRVMLGLRNTQFVPSTLTIYYFDHYVNFDKSSSYELNLQIKEEEFKSTIHETI